MGACPEVITMGGMSALAAPSASTSPGLVGLRQRWVVAFVAGELVGFLPPAVTGAALATAGVGDLTLTVGLTLAGSLEGAALGYAQARVVTGVLPGLSMRRWILATALGAALAWLAGMGGSAAIGAFGTAALFLAVPGFALGLPAMGFLQWRTLRDVLPRSGRWVPVTTGAWLVGVPIPVLALGLVPDDWPEAARAVVAVLAAVAMGATVALLTGTTLLHLLRTRDQTREGRAGREGR
jgi:hypothetical protein